MNANKWADVWNRRDLSFGESSMLQTLIYLDGFDGGAGRIDEFDWQTYIRFVSDRLGITDGASLYEVGCGSGAFLYLFYLAGHHVGGLDYSGPLIGKATEVFTGMKFTLGEASALDLSEKYDYVISNGVFHYFPDLDYAKCVVKAMLLKARRSVAILEVPDAALKTESENTRRGMLPPEEYDKKYKGLEHLYIDRSWFEKTAAEFNCSCRIFDQNIRGYGNNTFRFNCILEKI